MGCEYFLTFGGCAIGVYFFSSSVRALKDASRQDKLRYLSWQKEAPERSLSPLPPSAFPLLFRKILVCIYPFSLPEAVPSRGERGNLP